MSTQDMIAAPGTQEAIARRAAEFYQRRRFWAWSEADQNELDAWLAESVLHRVAWLRVEGGVAGAEKLAAMRAAAPQANVARKRFVLPLLAAASTVLVAVLGFAYVHTLRGPPALPPMRSFATDVGGQALLKFGDGTQVDLNTSTGVRYRMTTAERTVWLDKGEAWFRVAHNAANPFTVIAAGHRITDLGTEFLVRDDADRLHVALVTGRAQLASENPGTAVATLVPGDEAVATRASTLIVKKTPQQLADALAWQRGVIVFRNTRLADAVREFNRYNETKLVIADPAIADVKFSAELKTDHYEDFVELAQTVLKLRIDRQGNDILILRASKKRHAP